MTVSARRCCVVIHLTIYIMLAWVPVSQASSSPSIKNESRGTAIFFEWLDDRFAVATDSIGVNDSGKPVDFDNCKIVVQGKSKTFLTVSGGVRRVTLGYTAQGHRIEVNWDTQKMAAEAYEAVRGAKDPEKVANEWKSRSLAQLNSLPIEGRLRLRQIKDNRMLFAGLRSDGSIDVWTARFHFDGKQFDMTLERPAKNHVLPMAEGIEAAREFAKQQTARSKQEFERWKSLVNSTFVRTDAELKTDYLIELVQWVIDHPGTDAIGGSVEAVKLEPNSTITWLRPCPKDHPYVN
jgi:hypothetical protein